MIKKLRLITAIMAIFLSLTSIADPVAVQAGEAKNSHKSDDELEKIINDFNSYSARIALNIREEVKEYRIKIANINREKRELYKRLTQEAQNYLVEEQKYKKRILALKKETTIKQENSSSNENKGTAK